MAKHVFLANQVLKTTVSCPKDEYVRIGERKVLAGELIAPGFHVNAGQESSLGRIYFKPCIAGGTQMNGTLRIAVHDASDIQKELIFEGHTSELSAVVTDRRTWRVTEEQPVRVKENSKFVYYFKNDDATSTMTQADSKLYQDMTLFNV